MEEWKSERESGRERYWERERERKRVWDTKQDIYLISWFKVCGWQVFMCSWKYIILYVHEVLTNFYDIPTVWKCTRLLGHIVPKITC